jgi:hypothetical protein
MILDDREVGRSRGAGSPRSVDRVARTPLGLLIEAPSEFVGSAERCRRHQYGGSVITTSFTALT